MAALCGSKSHFHHTVHLKEWWLIWNVNEDNQKKLAIAGYTSRDQRASRDFSSSPILRRHDVFTLETTDGIYVRIDGLINKIRTEENGFPSEVFKCFFFGFPPHWEVCAKHYLAGRFASNDVSREDASLKGSSQTLEDCNTTNVGAYVSPVGADPKLDKDQAVCPIREGSQTVMYIIETGGAKDPGWKTADIEIKSNLKENTDIREASKSEKKTQNNVSSDDASLKGCCNANINEMTDASANVRLFNTDPELDQDHAARTTLDGSKNSNEVVRYITRTRGAKDTDERKTADIERESNLKEIAVIKEARTAEEKTRSNAPSDDASLKGCSIASEQTNEMKNTNANVSLAIMNPEVDQDPTACMILEGSENSNEVVRSITRSCGAKDSDQRRTTDTEMESNLKENAVIKEASIAEENACNNVSTEDASLEGCSTASEQINEMNSTEANGSPVTPKADVTTSFSSPGFSSAKRSRSGRILLPPLEYWHNQTVVYDPDHQVIGIKDGISTPSRVELTHKPSANNKLTYEPKRGRGRPRSKKDPKAANNKLTHEPKRGRGRPRSKKDPNAANNKLTHEPKRGRGRPRSKKDHTCTMHMQEPELDMQM